MDRKPAVGDVIVIGKRAKQLVVESFEYVDSDDIRHEQYHADVFRTIKFDDIDKPNPRVKTYQVPFGSMNVGEEVQPSNIKLVDKVAFKVVSTVVYKLV